MRYITFVFAVFLCSIGYAHNTEWVPYNLEVIPPPVVETPLVPSITYTTFTIPINRVRYQWVPVHINRPVVVNTWGILCKKQQVIYQPQIEWTLQPIYYR